MRSGGKFMRTSWFMALAFDHIRPCGDRRKWPQAERNYSAIYLNAAAAYRRKGHTENARILVGQARSLRLGAEPEVRAA